MLAWPDVQNEQPFLGAQVGCCQRLGDGGEGIIVCFAENVLCAGDFERVLKLILGVKRVRPNEDTPCAHDGEFKHGVEIAVERVKGDAGALTKLGQSADAGD